MFLLPILLAATVTTAQPAPVPKCQIEGTVQEANLQPAFDLDCVKTKNCPENFQGSWPEGYLIKLMVNSVDSACSVISPKDKVTSVFINKTNVKGGDTFFKGMVLGGMGSYKEMIALESYKIVSESGQASLTPAAQNPTATPVKEESFLSVIINAIKKLFGWK